jgi:hypothetical protein
VVFLSHCCKYKYQNFTKWGANSGIHYFSHLFISRCHIQSICDVKNLDVGLGGRGGGRNLSWLTSKFYPGMHLEVSKKNTAKLIQHFLSWSLYVERTKYLIPRLCACTEFYQASSVWSCQIIFCFTDFAMSQHILCGHNNNCIFNQSNTSLLSDNCIRLHVSATLGHHQALSVTSPNYVCICNFWWDLECYTNKHSLD